MPHALTLLPSSSHTPQSYVCNLCFDEGCGPAYRCSDCNFVLHVRCAAMEPLAMHFTHPEHPLNLTPPYPPPRKPICDSCGSNIKGWSFRCDECDFDLHSVCASAPRFMRHLCHPHPLELRFQDTAKNLRCSACENVLRHYAYECVHCDFRVHQICARLSEFVKHPLHPEHSLLFNFSEPSISRLPRCNKCGQVVEGMEYRCAICDIHFHHSCTDMEEHHLPHNEATSDDINGRRTESSATTSQTLTSHHAARNIEIRGAANSVVEAQHRDDLEALKRIVQLMENMIVSRAVDSDEIRGQNNSDTIAVDHCPTCLEGFDSTNPRKTTSCGHTFHLPCLLEWMEQSTRCPICRADIEI
ncbi:hypothetical protein KP509_33G006400 [Ceratopteris richardii]|uniref:Uncharacterized protein n=1 Tax=Ceratopteris richardii TaxID=49495 RepID=A0A8T2QN20_CERRI|nr:hypothetical protein KP509_33G006400 [Ceratopteris richardii]